jgi:hypothetical protein
MEEKLKLSPESISELFDLISRSENSWDNFCTAQDNVISCRKGENYKCCDKEDCELIKLANKEYDRMRDDESKLASWVRRNAIEIAASIGATRNECGSYIREKAERNIKRIGYKGSYLLALASEIGIIL